MQWSDDGRIQITRKFALGTALVIVALALAAMFLIGMLVAGGGDGESAQVAHPTPTALAAEQDADVDGEGRSPQQASKNNYSTCLARTWRAISLDTKGVDFKPWEDRSTTREVESIIQTGLRHVDYIAEYCRPMAPEPPESSSATCIPRELQAFYRKHIPEGSDTASHMAIAAEYALTVCQPSADR